ncbi:hypothetical protein RJT34_17574 [Clitoria ternatea]|uniref:Uncharacterized protein n=1 Tax=Clitoria ternatea TaxID=43366 RepID=A0AAN9J9L6_CLITE
MMKERDEELALFLEMRRREKENEKNNLLLLQNSEEFDLSNLESNRGSSMISKIVSSMPPRKTGVEEFLNSENDKSDYEWLLTPPDTPLFPTLEKESQISVKSELEIHNTRPTALKPRVANIQPETATRSNAVSKHYAPMPGLSSSTTSTRRPSSSGGPTSATSRSSTPSGRPTLPSTTKSSRSSTPTSRTTMTSVKSTVPSVRTSTPTRSTARASTPTSRPSLAAPPKTSQRSATPTLRSSTPSKTFGVSAPPTRPSSASKARPVVVKNPVQSRGISPSVKSRPLQPSQMPGFPVDAPPNLKTSVPERPASATRTRPGAPNSRSSSVEASGGGKSRRQSSTPSKGRASNGFVHSSQSSMQALSRARFTDGDEESPVVIGTKMVERVVNMRKLAPPKHEDHRSSHNNSYGKSTSSGSSGFGSTLSKKSLDMAMRHMDIRRSIQGNLRPLVTSIPASSMYSVRSGSCSSRSRTVSVSDSPLATSSTASSEPSVNNNSMSYDGSEVEENDFGSEREQ